MNENETTLKIEEIGYDSDLPYQKVDIFKAYRLGNNYCVSFYQLNYQKITNILVKERKTKELKATEGVLFPVFKTVMDQDGMMALRDEINRLLEKVRMEKNEKVKL